MFYRRFCGLSGENPRLETEIEGQGSSAITGDLLRCKFTPSATFVYDTKLKHTEAPQFWRNWTVNAMVKARGKWESRTQSGLCLEVTDIQLIEPPAAANESRPCPFDPTVLKDLTNLAGPHWRDAQTRGACA